MARLRYLLIALLLAAPIPGQARDLRPSELESFAIGTSGTPCEAQGVPLGDARQSIFERKFVILCSDIARPVGTAYVLRSAEGGAARVAAIRSEPLDCTEPAAGQTGGAATCRSRASGLDWRVYDGRRGKSAIVVEGLAGYDSALRIVLANLTADRLLPGEVSVVNLGSDGSNALLDAKAAVTDVDTLMGQGYRNNSAGAYTEAAGLFAAAPALLSNAPPAVGGDSGNRAGRLHELRINRALQLSNLGDFAQSSRLFGEAALLAASDPVQTRLARNYEAIDAINQSDLEGAAEILARPVPSVIAPPPSEAGIVRIDYNLAEGLNTASGDALGGLLGQETRLTPQERAIILDAQALQLRGTVARLQGRLEETRGLLSQAYSKAIAVRDGRVTSIARLRAQVLSEMAATYETESRFGEADALLHQALTLVERQYPDSASVNVARARLAGFFARRGRRDEALLLYSKVIESVSTSRTALVGMENLMRPYFDLLAESSASQPKAVADLFIASQLVERPGAADTMTQLARQLEGGSDETAALFRDSLVLSREIERNRVATARLNAQVQEGASPAGLDLLKQQQERLLASQLKIMSALAAYPQYRAVAHRFVTLDDLRASLKPDEAYLKLVELSGAYYAIYASPTAAKGWRVAKNADAIAEDVANLRNSISVTINGTQSTYPFAIDTAADLYDALLGPVAGELASARHLIFEPDGSLLQLPINLLTNDRAAAAAYHQRVDQGGDAFDFRGIAWLGRTTQVSTSLSAASFRDARQAPSSRAGRSYLGLGNNVPVGPASLLPATRGASASGEDGDCSWPATAWNNPISASELRIASSLFGKSQADLMTGAAFTDAAIESRPDLGQFRIVHFATHGLTSAPREGCPTEPALLTSFGGAGSDGLLSFTEIFDLKLDADLVILSACDTASQAGLEATQAAGLSSGGGQALDGLVRAFIAAGGRDVIASHWPAPDDYNATQRLFSTFFRERGSTIGGALQDAQRALMDEPATSHPFYWAGFAIIGDGAKPLTGQ